MLRYVVAMKISASILNGISSMLFNLLSGSTLQWGMGRGLLWLTALVLRLY